MIQDYIYVLNVEPYWKKQLKEGIHQEYLMVELDILIGEPSKTPASYTFRHFTDGRYVVNISIHDVRCPICQESYFKSEQYEHALEHEYVEIYTMKALFEDGLLNKFEQSGFDHLFKKVHGIPFYHVCDGCEISGTFG